VLIKHLEYLVALAREKHFARAAAVCHVTQPTLSAGIKQLEDSLGVLVVERGQRFRGLTPEGERVLAWAQRILSDVDGLRQDVSETHGGLVGRLRLGAIPAALPMVALVTAPFVERYPAASTTIWSLTSIEIQRGLDDFTLDAGISYLDNEPLARVRTVPLYRERYVLITSALGPMGHRTSVGWREAADLPLCLMTPDMQNRRILDGHFRSVGATARPHVEANTMVALASHLRFGNYSAVLPKTLLAVIGNLPDMIAIPLVEPEVSHEIGLIVADREPPTPVAAAAVRVADSLTLGATIDQLTWPKT